LYPPSPKLAKTGHNLMTYSGFFAGFWGDGLSLSRLLASNS
jgi:hypothetical protein